MKKIIDFLLGFSPLVDCMFIGFLILCSPIYYFKYHYEWKWVMENITSVDWPDYEVLNWDQPLKGISNSDETCLLIEFEEVIPEETIQKLDELCKLPDSNWSKDGDSYKFYCMWGNDMGKTPKGEFDFDDKYYSLRINKKSKGAELTFGSW